MNNSSAPTLTVGFCGSGKYSVRVAEALRQNHSVISWVICPPAKPSGRGHKVQESALATWAKLNSIPIFEVKTSLEDLLPSLEQLPRPDFLVVVSFGYLVPAWLLQLPKLAPINVHPSALPKFRGSSPGQFTILYGETTSSVTIMVMSESFDTGEVIRQIPFDVPAQMTQTDFYNHAFALAEEKLPSILQEYSKNPVSVPQGSENSSLPMARRLNREDGFLPFSLWESAQTDGNQKMSPEEKSQLGLVLQELVSFQPEITKAQLVDRAVHALTPWPGVWTTIPEYKGKNNTRLKIWVVKITNNGSIESVTLQYEGEPKKS